MLKTKQAPGIQAPVLFLAVMISVKNSYLNVADMSIVPKLLT